jgi:hypothetical protein
MSAGACGLVPCDAADLVRLAFLLLTAACFAWVFGAPLWRKGDDDD